jgi:hypothetical protein
MSSQVRAVEHVLLSLLSQNPAPPKRNPAAIAITLSGVLILAGLGFMLAAGYDWLLANYDIQTARLFMGGLCLILAAIAAAVAGAIIKLKIRKAETYYVVLRENLEAMLSMIGDELEDPIRENPKTAVLVAGLAGYVAAEKLLH